VGDSQGLPAQVCDANQTHAADFAKRNLIERVCATAGPIGVVQAQHPPSISDQ
jgi:hypothetical protein